MKKEPSKAAVAAWTRLVRGHAVAMDTVEASLKRAGFPALSWYDVLLELDRAGEDGLRPFELERLLLLPQYGLSRLLDRIEAKGYLARRSCETDGRGQVVVITRNGRDIRRRMWPVYAAGIEAAVSDKLSESEMATLATLLAKIGTPEAKES
jgi:DNA-binding MarR family transcriptional regulator